MVSCHRITWVESLRSLWMKVAGDEWRVAGIWFIYLFIYLLIDRSMLVSEPFGPDEPSPLITGPLCPISDHGSPVALLKPQVVPMLLLLISSGTKKKDARRACLSEAKASLSQRMWAKVSSFTPNFLHRGLSSSPSRWRFLLRLLSPVRRPVTALDCVLLKESILALVPRLGPEINFRACIWVSPRSRQLVQCWLTNQRLSSFFMSR